MALDPIEKTYCDERWPNEWGSFWRAVLTVSCVSGHFYFEPHFCDLYVRHRNADEILVIKNRAGKKLQVSVPV